MIEKFTEADVYATDENDVLIDEGTFIDGGFVSDLNNEKCSCTTRNEHEEHLRNLMTLEETKNLYI